MKVSTIKPGFLVSLKTSCSGNVQYSKVDLERSRKLAKWQTTRTTADPAEFERMKETRSQAVYTVRRVCNLSNFGLLCAEKDADKLESAIADAQALVRKFNATARLTRLNFYVIAGRIAADDVEAMRAINSEVSELLERMAQGVRDLDTSAIRKAANKAKQVGNMLTPQAEARLGEAIWAARRAARQIAKSGETAAIKIDRLYVESIKTARTMFLDVRDLPPIEAPQAESRAIDLIPVSEVASPTPSSSKLDI